MLGELESQPQCHCPAATTTYAHSPSFIIFKFILKNEFLLKIYVTYTTLQHGVFSCPTWLAKSFLCKYADNNVFLSISWLFHDESKGKIKVLSWNRFSHYPLKQINYHKPKLVCKGNRIKQKAHWGFLAWLLQFWETAHLPFNFIVQRNKQPLSQTAGMPLWIAEGIKHSSRS